MSEEGNYRAYKVCKHDCRSKHLGYQNELESLLIFTYLGIKISLVCSPKRQYFYSSIVN